jgi:hypothetical protein
MKKKTYKTRTGLIQFKAPIGWAAKSSDAGEGFCLACGKVQGGCEPDARRYPCEACSALKVYGGEELISMGLVF